MSSQWSTAPGAPDAAPVARKWPWAPWLAVAGAALSLLTMLMPWVTVDGTGDSKSVHFNKFAGTGWLKSFGSESKISDGGWSAHAWLTLMVLIALIIVATMLVKDGLNKMLAYVLAGLGALLLIMLIWGLIAAGTLSGSINDLGGQGSSDKAGMAAGAWLFLVTSLITLAGIALTLLPILAKPKSAQPQAVYGQQQGQWGQPQQGGYPQQGQQQGQWGQPQQGGYPQQGQQQGQWGQPQQGDNQSQQGW